MSSANWRPSCLGLNVLTVQQSVTLSIMTQCTALRVYCKKDVTPLLTHWSSVFLTLTHRCASPGISEWIDMTHDSGVIAIWSWYDTFKWHPISGYDVWCSLMISSSQCKEPGHRQPWYWAIYTIIFLFCTTMVNPQVAGTKLSRFN